LLVFFIQIPYLVKKSLGSSTCIRVAYLSLPISLFNYYIMLNSLVSALTMNNSLKSHL
jgi:hypothetical protein